MNNNINCESCYQVICCCRDIIAEQEAIERLQEMPVAEGVMELWPTESVETIAKVLEIELRQVLMVLETFGVGRTLENCTCQISKHG